MPRGRRNLTHKPHHRCPDNSHCEGGRWSELKIRKFPVDPFAARESVRADGKTRARDRIEVKEPGEASRSLSNNTRSALSFNGQRRKRRGLRLPRSTPVSIWEGRAFRAEPQNPEWLRLHGVSEVRAPPPPPTSEYSRQDERWERTRLQRVYSAYCRAPPTLGGSDISLTRESSRCSALSLG